MIATPLSGGTVRDAGSARLLVFGDGFTGSGMANQAFRHMWHVACTTRLQWRCTPAHDTPSRAERPVPHVVGFNPCQAALTGYQPSDELVEWVATATHILLTIPSIATPLYDPVLRAQQDLIVQHTSSALQWLGYLSSTGVYGDWGGDWVDEDAPPRPSSARGLVRLEHERAWQALAERHALPLHTFRLGGIYGPGRSALDAVGRATESSSQRRRGRQRYTARVHVWDIVRALLASAAAPQPGTLLNVVDDEPAPRGEVLAYAAALLGARGSGGCATGAVTGSAGSEAGSEAAGGSGGESASSGRVRAAPLEEKRVRNARLKEQLGLQLAYPSYREGLVAIASGDTRPFDALDLERLGRGRAGAE